MIKRIRYFYNKIISNHFNYQATDMVDCKQKLKNQLVQIEINRVQPGKPSKPGNFFQLVSFPFQCISAFFTYRRMTWVVFTVEMGNLPNQVTIKTRQGRSR